jgi:membrane protein
MIESASNPKASSWATVIGLVTMMITITGVFSQVQTALNIIWKVQSRESAMSRLVRARLTSLGLVVTSGFLLTVSLATSAGLAALSDWLKFLYPDINAVAHLIDAGMSGLLIAGLFAAIYKVLPDTSVAWRDVAVGAIVTMLLFEAGKYLIALYVGQSNVASTYGAAGALIVLLLWIYYSAQIFLLGAEFTHAFAQRFGSRSG